MEKEKSPSPQTYGLPPLAAAIYRYARAVARSKLMTRICEHGLPRWEPDPDDVDELGQEIYQRLMQLIERQPSIASGGLENPTLRRIIAGIAARCIAIDDCQRRVVQFFGTESLDESQWEREPADYPDVIWNAIAEADETETERRLMAVACAVWLSIGDGPDARQAVYAALADRAASILSAGYSCVLDATFLDPDSRQVIGRIGRDHGTPPRTFWLDAPPGILRARIAGRHHDASDADGAVLERQLSQPAPEDWTRIDVSGSPAEAQARLLAALPRAA